MLLNLKHRSWLQSNHAALTATEAKIRKQLQRKEIPVAANNRQATGSALRQQANFQNFNTTAASGTAVGYQPVITTLSEGVSLSVLPVVSADRRYVRISTTPVFTNITDVFTFGFVQQNP
ncbi:MAG: hypothetical protein R3C11_03475 [Planctomycetaceae bacterium]